MSEFAEICWRYLAAFYGMSFVYFFSILIYINFINVSLSLWGTPAWRPRGYSSRVFGSTLALLWSARFCFLFYVFGFLFFFFFSFYLLYCLVSAPLTVLLSGTFADATQINYDSLFI